MLCPDDVEDLAQVQSLWVVADVNLRHHRLLLAVALLAALLVLCLLVRDLAQGVSVVDPLALVGLLVLVLLLVRALVHLRAVVTWNTRRNTMKRLVKMGIMHVHLNITREEALRNIIDMKKK
jgi:hypothetical protein